MAAAGLAAALLAQAGPAPVRAGFDRVLGGGPHLALVLAVTVAGVGAFAYLRSRGWGRRRPGAAGWVRIALISAALALPAILIDLVWPFPADINVPLPHALLFYPAIGFVAEILFHLLPLALLVAFAGGSGPDRALPLLAVVALTEPVFQVLAADPAESPLRAALLAAALFVFGGFQLLVYARLGFAAMFAARMAYYAVWHGLWGTLRLWIL